MEGLASQLHYWRDWPAVYLSWDEAAVVVAIFAAVALVSLHSLLGRAEAVLAPLLDEWPEVGRRKIAALVIAAAGLLSLVAVSHNAVAVIYEPPIFIVQFLGVAFACLCSLGSIMGAYGVNEVLSDASLMLSFANPRYRARNSVQIGWRSPLPLGSFVDWL